MQKVHLFIISVFLGRFPYGIDVKLIYLFLFVRKFI